MLQARSGRVLLLLVAAIAAVLALGACGGGEETTPEIDAGEVLDEVDDGAANPLGVSDREQRLYAESRAACADAGPREIAEQVGLPPTAREGKIVDGFAEGLASSTQEREIASTGCVDGFAERR